VLNVIAQWMTARATAAGIEPTLRKTLGILLADELVFNFDALD
jgi:hypothetical protein